MLWHSTILHVQHNIIPTLLCAHSSSMYPHLRTALTRTLITSRATGISTSISTSIRSARRASSAIHHPLRLSSTNSSSTNSSIRLGPSPAFAQQRATMSSLSPQLELAQRACGFLTASTDPFHAVATSIDKLQQHGFEEIDVKEPFVTAGLKPGGRYYYTIHGSSIVAFVVGSDVSADKPFGFHILGGHTDSPNLKLKPKSKSTNSKNGATMLGVECYGGGLWHTWFDRDLGISGRVMVKASAPGGATGGDDDGFGTRLVKLQTAVARISTLCIHLQSADERKAFAVNKETHTSPMIATTAGLKSDTAIETPSNDSNKEILEKQVEEQINTWQAGQEPLLLKAIAEELGIDVEAILDWELSFFDTQAAAVGGIGKDLLYSARLDNLATCFCAITGLCESNPNTEDINVVVLFDHEEVGSTSSHGAGSPVIQEAVERISAAICGGSINPDLYRTNIHRSFCLSIDQAHAIHPNYASKHEPQHAPKMNDGVVVKTNSNQRYTTNGMTGFLLRELGREANVPMQEFVVKNDCPCGSTIGPMISAKTGIRTVDAGMPQLSMHSCREVMGVQDLTYGVTLFKTFFEKFRIIDSKLSK